MRKSIQPSIWEVCKTHPAFEEFTNAQIDEMWLCEINEIITDWNKIEYKGTFKATFKRDKDKWITEDCCEIADFHLRGVIYEDESHIMDCCKELESYFEVVKK